MKHNNAWLFLTLATGVLLPLLVSPRKGAAQESEPADVVQKLYREITALHPMGVPHGAAKKAIWPLLSSRLIAAFNTRNACDKDWDRKHPYSPEHPIKAPGFYEDGLFSGPNERGYINGAITGDTVRGEAHGAYLVDVNLWSYSDMGDRSLRNGKIDRWRIIARVTSEDGRFVVDDILGPKGVFDYDKSVYMSRMLATGCKGAHSTSD
jgi:hypothetical protein